MSNVSLLLLDKVYYNEGRAVKNKYMLVQAFNFLSFCNRYLIGIKLDLSPHQSYSYC